MSTGKYLIGMLGLLLLSSISSAYTLYNNALYCTDCTDCTSALNNDTYNITYLNATISGAAGTCISDPGLIDNRIFDCNNYTISGSGAGSGFFTSGELNATVRGCNISGFLYGILISDSSHNATVENCVTYNNTNTGTFIDSSSDVTVLNSLSFNNTNYGFRIRDSDDTGLDNATAYNNSLYGFYLYNADRTLINNSVAHNNGVDGVDITSALGDSLNNTIKNTYSYNNSENGFALYTSNTVSTTFQNCTARNNTFDGFFISNGDYNWINNSIADLNARDGIRFDTGVVQSSILSTRSYLNGGIGIHIREGCSNNGIANATAYSNGNHGIYLSTGDQNILVGYLGDPIYAHDNNGSGIYLYKQTNILLDGNFPPFTSGIIVESNLNNGLVMEQCTNVTAYDITATNHSNGSGVLVVNSTFTNITLAEVSGAINGILITGGANITLVNANVENSSQIGIYLNTTSTNSLSNISAFNNGGGAGANIYLYDTNNCTLQNIESEFSFWGIVIEETVASGSNLFYNTLIYNTTRPLGIVTTLENNFTNITLGYNATIGLINWDFLNLTSVVTNFPVTNLRLGRDYVSLNDSTLPQMNKSANITINVSSCTPTRVVYRKTGFPSTRADIIANGSVYNTSLTCASNVARFNVSGFSGFAADPPVSTCMVINESNLYTLTNNLTGAPNDASEVPDINWTCIKIAASDVVVDCNGYNILNNGTTDASAIAVNGSSSNIYTNITVRNCPGIANYTYGVYSYFSDKAVLSNLTVLDSSEIGVYLRNSSNSIFANSTVNGGVVTGLQSVNAYIRYSLNATIENVFVQGENYGLRITSSDSTALGNVTTNNSGNYGIYAEDSPNIFAQQLNTAVCGLWCSYFVTTDNFTLKDSTASEAAINSGFWISNSGNINLTNVTSHDNNWYGYQVVSSSGRISNSRAFDNALTGFYLTPISNLRVTDSFAYSNDQNGFFIGYGGNVTLQNSTAYNNTDGIVLEGSENDSVVSNVAYNNSQYGFHLDTSHYNNLTDNTAYNNTLHGFYLEGSSYNNLTNDIAYNNTVDGFHIRSSTDNVLSDSVSYNNTERGFFTEQASHRNIFNNLSALDNGQDGFFLVNSQNLTVANSTAYGNGYGFQLDNANGTTLSNLEAHGNSGSGVLLGNSVINATNLHLYDNTLSELSVAAGATGFFTVNITNATIDNPAGNYQNYTSLIINDNQPTVGSVILFDVKWKVQPVAPSPGYVSFEQKYVNITATVGSPSIDSIRWTWLDGELGPYNESKFELWKHNGTWSYETGQTLVAGSNYIEMLNFQPSSTYGILQNNLSSCMVISAPGSYQLTNSVVGAPFSIALGEVPGISWACIKIAASDVVFDCNGYSITNNGTANAAGITTNDSRTNVTIQNCPSVSQYSRYGIYIFNASDSWLLHSGANNNAWAGILVSLSRNITLINNTAYDQGTSGPGFLLSVMHNSTLINNTAYNNSNCYDLTLSTSNNLINNRATGCNACFQLEQTSTNNNMTDNTANQCSLEGFGIVTNAENNTFRNNTAYNATDGFAANGVGLNRFIGNAAYNNSRDGFLLIFGANSNVLANNTAYDNSRFGFTVSGSTYNNLTGNRAYNNTDGFHIEDADYNRLENNDAYNNTAGAYLYLADYTTLINNTAYSNTEYGMHIQDSDNPYVAEGRIFDNPFAGIRVDDGSDNAVLYNINVTSNSQDGIQVYLSNYANLTGNRVYDNGQHGIDIFDAWYHTVQGNTVYDNGGRGIDFGNVVGSNVSNNRVYNNTQRGIQLRTYSGGPSTNNLFVNNSVFNNSESGFYLITNSDFNTFINNSVYINGENGFYSVDSDNCNYTGNNASDNAVNGFYLNNSALNTFTGNIADNNANAGFLLDPSDNNDLYYNTMDANVYGIYLDGSSSNNIIGNNITNTGADGIYGVDCTLNVISGNNIFDTVTDSAIWLDDDCDNNQIYDNLMIGGPWGVAVYASITTVEYNIVRNNTIHDFQYCIELQNALYNDVLNNTVYNCSVFGIGLDPSPDNNIVNNTAYNSTIGFLLEDDSLPSSFEDNLGYDNGIGLSIDSTDGFSTNLGNEGNELRDNAIGVQVTDSDNTVITRALDIHDNGFEIYGTGTINFLTIEETGTPEQEYVTLANGAAVTNLYLLNSFAFANGRVNFPALAITPASADIPLNNTNFLLAGDFISLNDSAQPDYNVSADVWLNTTSCTGLNVYMATGFPPDRDTILTTGATIAPTYMACAGNLANFGVASFSGYALNVTPTPTPSDGGGPSKRCEKADIELVTVICPGNTVIYRVTDENGDALGGERVYIRSNGPYFSEVQYTDSYGEFEFTPPYTSEYVIRAAGGSSDYCEVEDTLDYTLCPPVCYDDGDCEDVEYCSGEGPYYALDVQPVYADRVEFPGVCLPVECECGEVYGHTCHPYECCANEDCSEGYRCDNHVCVPERPECEVDEDCAFDEYCSNGTCMEIQPGECGYIANHTWLDYECCEDDGCDVGYICEAHTCTPRVYTIETNDTGFVGDNHSARVLPEGSYTLTLTDPTGRQITVQTDERGYAQFILESEGTYSVFLFRDAQVAANVTVDALKRVIIPEEKPTIFDELLKNWCWIAVIILLLVIGYLLYRRRRGERFKFSKK